MCVSLHMAGEGVESVIMTMYTSVIHKLSVMTSWSTCDYVHMLSHLVTNASP